MLSALFLWELVFEHGDDFACALHCRVELSSQRESDECLERSRGCLREWEIPLYSKKVCGQQGESSSVQNALCCTGCGGLFEAVEVCVWGEWSMVSSIHLEWLLLWSFSVWSLFTNTSISWCFFYLSLCLCPIDYISYPKVAAFPHVVGFLIDFNLYLFFHHHSCIIWQFQYCISSSEWKPPILSLDVALTQSQHYLTKFKEICSLDLICVSPIPP